MQSLSAGNPGVCIRQKCWYLSVVTNDEVVVPQWSHLNCVTTFGFRFRIEDVLI